MRRLLVPAALFLLACGKVSGEGEQLPTGNNNNTNGPGTGTSTLAIEGSFDVTFTSANADWGGSAPPGMTSPSLKTAARLDLRKNASGGYDAVLTPRWQAPAAFSVQVTAESLVLTGQGSISISQGVIAGATDRWKTLTLGRNEDGSLDGSFTGTGDAQAGAGDVLWSGTLTGAGKFVPDATAPELRTVLNTFSGREDVRFPWDPIIVEAAEPVASQAAAGPYVASGSDTLGVTWIPVTSTWAGATRWTGYVGDWDQATAKPWQVKGDSSLADFASHAIVPFDASMRFFTAGSPATQIAFNDDVINVRSFGTTAIYGGGEAGTNDPRCEVGGCFRIGPIDVNSCETQRSGFGAMLTRQTEGRTELRYRLLARTTSVGGPQKPFIPNSPVTMQVATPHVAPVEAPVPHVDLAELATPVDGMTWASEWSTASANLPTGNGPVGVAVAATTPGYCGGPPGPPAEIEILVQSVASK